MFTVQFFDVLTGVQAMSHPKEYKRAATTKTKASKGLFSWFKR